MTTKSLVKSAWAEDMGQLLYHLDPDPRKITKRLEKLQLRIINSFPSFLIKLAFIYIYIYTHNYTHTHTHTHTYIYIYKFIYKRKNYEAEIHALFWRLIIAIERNGEYVEK